MTATKKRKFLFNKGEKNFVNTKALETYRKSHHLTGQQIADTLTKEMGVPVTDKMVLRWSVRGRVPRAVAKQLDLQTRGGYRQRAVTAPFPSSAKVSTYIAHVQPAQEQAFKAFASSMGIKLFKGESV